MNDDLISRQAVINKLLEWYDYEEYLTKESLEMCIEELPAAHCDNCPYPDDYDGMNETAHKRSETAFGAGLFFRYYALQIGQFSLFAEASAGLKMGNVKEEYKIDNVTRTVDNPKTTEIFAGIVPGISYKMNEKWQFDAYLGLCELRFVNSTSKLEKGVYTYTNTNNNFDLGINQHSSGKVLTLGVVYNF